MSNLVLDEGSGQFIRIQLDHQIDTTVQKTVDFMTKPISMVGADF